MPRQISHYNVQEESHAVGNRVHVCGMPVDNTMQMYIWITLVVAVLGLGCAGWAAHSLTVRKDDSVELDIFIVVFLVTVIVFLISSLILAVGVLTENCRLCLTWVALMILSKFTWISYLVFEIVTKGDLAKAVPAVILFTLYPSAGVYIVINFVQWIKRERRRREHPLPEPEHEPEPILTTPVLDARYYTWLDRISLTQIQERLAEEEQLPKSRRSTLSFSGM